MKLKVNIFLVLVTVTLFACKKDQVQDTNPANAVVISTESENSSITNGRKSSPLSPEGINGSNTGDEDKD